MMVWLRNLLSVLMILFTANGMFSQAISSFDGTWYWNSANKENSFELHLLQTEPAMIEGHHCSTFYSGKKIDCLEDTKECSINLTQIDQNVFQGTIKSGFSSMVGTLKLTYDPIRDRIYFELLTEPEGEYFIPDDIYLKKWR